MACDSGGYCGESLRPELDEVTRMLCEVLSSLQTTDGLSLEVRAWWDAHQKADRARQQREAAVADLTARRSAALAKLTPEERRLIGVTERGTQ